MCDCAITGAGRVSRDSAELDGLLQNGLVFEVIVFLQAGLLAFHPVGGFLNYSVKVIGVASEEAAGIALFAGGRCFP